MSSTSWPGSRGLGNVTGLETLNSFLGPVIAENITIQMCANLILYQTPFIYTDTRDFYQNNDSGIKFFKYNSWKYFKKIKHMKSTKASSNVLV